jgi:hypothetical protein
MKISNDELEYLISQYIDGTINELDRARVDEVLATDASARAILAEYRNLNTVVKSAMPMPQIAWDEFQSRIASKCDKLEAPVRHYRLTFATVSRVAAIAAVLAIVVGGIVMMRPHGTAWWNQGPVATVGGGDKPAVNTAPIDVQISAPPALAAAPVTEISIGRPSGFAAADFHSTEAVISQPSSIQWIASDTTSAQDNGLMMY